MIAAARGNSSLLLLLILHLYSKDASVFALNSPKSSIVNHSKINVKDGGNAPMVVISPTLPSHHHSGAATSLLKYSKLSEEQKYSGDEKVDDWIGKWFEENFHVNFSQWKKRIGLRHKADNISHVHFAPDLTSVDGLGKVEKRRGTWKEIDKEMSGSTITHFELTNDVENDIEILPVNDQMLDIFKIKDHQEDTYDKPSVVKRISRRMRRRQKSKKKESIFSILSSSKHTERVSLDIRHLSLAIAGNIDNEEQWKEFFEDSRGEGLLSILQCVRDVANEIKQGYAADLFDQNDDNDSMLDTATRRENAFVAACSAVRVLRDLCSIDQNWSSMITDEILIADRNCRKEGEDSFMQDLATVLKYANEAEFFYNRKVSRKRRELRAHGITIKKFGTRRQRRRARRRCILNINQLLLAMAIASDDAIHVFRSTPGLIDSIILSSSYTSQEKLRGRWFRYPVEKLKRFKNSFLKRNVNYSKRPFLEAAKIQKGLKGEMQATSNKLLAAIGHNVFVPKVPGQRGLRILSLDGGGTRGIASIAIIRAIVEEMGVEVCDLFDIICGTSTGAIIAFLVGLRLESSAKARNRYDELIQQIFVKSSLSTPMLFLTTAAYSEVPFKRIMEDILGDYSMLDSRGDPRVPYVFAVSSKMSSTTSKLSLFRNYNYRGGEKPDKFTVHPDDARKKLGFEVKKREVQDLTLDENSTPRVEGSRHEGSFRVLQRAALRATTAAPTYFKPVELGGDLYSDGGIGASNPTAIAIHEARTLFPDIPIELCVSCGTGEFVSRKKSPNFGWDGIIDQIVKSATDTAKTHWILEDILGQGHTCQSTSGVSSTKYFRFDPVIGTPADFPIDGTDAKQLQKLSEITTNYMKENDQKKKLEEIKTILSGNMNPFAS